VRRGEAAEGGGAGPATLRRLSLESGLEARSSSLSRLRFARCGGSVGPTEGIVGSCGVDGERGDVLAEVTLVVELGP
jgi:hypothetical protein